MTKSPVSFDCVSNVVPRVSLTSVTVAPGMTPPCASFTLPAIVAEDCADANDVMAITAMAMAATLMHVNLNFVMVPPDRTRSHQGRIRPGIPKNVGKIG